MAQRGGGRGDCARRRVGQALERQCAALEVDAPGMVGEGALVEPLAPEVLRARKAQVMLERIRGRLDRRKDLRELG